MSREIAGIALTASILILSWSSMEKKTENLFQGKLFQRKHWLLKLKIKIWYFYCTKK